MSEDDDSQAAELREEPVQEDPSAKKVEELDRKNRELLERLARLQAEFDNYRKRSAREREEYTQLASARLVKDLLGLIDNFERAMISQNGSNDAEALRKGTEMLYRQLKDILTAEGVVEIETDCRLDPFEHEVMMKVDDPEYADDEIVECLQKGYKMKGRVIRPARVVVCKLEKASEKGKEVIHDDSINDSQEDEEGE